MNTSSKQRRICCVINSRANYARIKSVLSELKKREDCKLQIIVGASGLLFRYGLVSELIRQDGFEITREVYSVVEGNEPVVMAKTTGLAILDLASIFSDLKPDVVVTIADRHETLATAIAASYMNIPVAHTQGGEITGSIDESVRHAVTKLSHLHFPATQKSYDNILQLGEEKERVFLVGCPSLDLINKGKLPYLAFVMKKYGIDPSVFVSSEFLLVLFHSDTQDYLKAGEETLMLLQAIEELDKPTIWLWPNVDSGTDYISKELRRHKEKSTKSKICFVRNFSPEEYITVLRNASCIIGNSSSGIREAALLGIPSVSLGMRQSGREVADNVVRLPHLSELEILKAIQVQILHGKFPPNALYGDGLSGPKIAEILCTVELQTRKSFVRRIH